jgi:hypothetical protein
VVDLTPGEGMRIKVDKLREICNKKSLHRSKVGSGECTPEAQLSSTERGNSYTKGAIRGNKICVAWHSLTEGSTHCFHSE